MMTSSFIVVLHTLILLSGGVIFMVFICMAIAFFMLIKSIPIDEEDKHGSQNDSKMNIDTHSTSIINIAPTKFGDLDFFVNSAFPNKQKILQDCVTSIKNTKNINVLISRYAVLLDVCQWMIEAKEQGFPITMSFDNNDFESDINWLINDNLARLATYNYQKYITEIYRLKTSKAVDSRTVAMFSLLEECKNFLKPHSNADTSLSTIENIHFLVEENYSNRSLGFQLSGNVVLGTKRALRKSTIKAFRKKITPPFFLKYNLNRRVELIYIHIANIRTSSSLSGIKESFSMVCHHFKILKAYNMHNRIDFFDDGDFMNNFNQMTNDNLVRISIDYSSKEKDIIKSDHFVQACIDYTKKAPNIGNTLSKLEGLIHSESHFTQIV